MLIFKTKPSCIVAAGRLLQDLFNMPCSVHFFLGADRSDFGAGMPCYRFNFLYMYIKAEADIG